MRSTLLGVLLAFGISAVQGEPEVLKPVDVEELLERLEDLQGDVKGREKARFGAAKTAFSAAIQSDKEALALYYNCVEKVQYEEANRSGKDFRDWKRRNKDRHGPDFQRALRHQLNWLLLTVEAASAEPEKRTSLGPKGLEKLDQMVNDLTVMGRHKSLLSENVLKTVFATAYGLGGIELQRWPLEPLKVQAVYEILIFPPLRKPESVGLLKAAWVKRIEQEGQLAAPQDPEKNGLAKRDDDPAKLELFRVEKRPQLVWEMEVDLFKAGDQRGAAVRMIEHIKKHLGHKSEGKWIAEFKGLIGAEKAETVEN